MRFLMSGSHDCHWDIAKYIGCDIQVLDKRVFKGQKTYDKLQTLFGNSFDVKDDDFLICESNYYYPALRKRCGMLKGEIVNMNVSPLYFHLKTGRLGNTEKKMLLSLLYEVDYHILWGNYGVEVLQRLNVDERPYMIAYPFIRKKDMDRYREMSPSLDSQRITSIITNDTRCKGLDIMLDAMLGVTRIYPDTRLDIIYSGIDDAEMQAAVEFRGLGDEVSLYKDVKDVSEYLKESCLYIQPSRGDTFGVACIEAAACGVPVLVSTETGAKEMVMQAGDLVCKPTAYDFTQGILSYLKSRKKGLYSERFKEVSARYTDEIQLPLFKQKLMRMLNVIR